MCCRQRKLVPPPEIARCMSFNVQRTCISGVPFAVLPRELGATCSVGACDRGVLFNAALPETLPGHTEVLMFLQIVLHGCVCPSAEAVKDVAVDKKLDQGAGHGPWRGAGAGGPGRWVPARCEPCGSSQGDGCWRLQVWRRCLLARCHPLSAAPRARLLYDRSDLLARPVV